MKNSIKKGLGFGLTSGVITTLGLIIGLYSSTNSIKLIIGGIIIIAVADSLSDALGIHIAEESGNKKSEKDIWETTFATLFCKFVFAMSFMIPFLLFDIRASILISIIWGLILISAFSFYISKGRVQSGWKIVAEHLAIAILVIISTYYVGIFVRNFFGY